MKQYFGYKRDRRLTDYTPDINKLKNQVIKDFYW